MKESTLEFANTDDAVAILKIYDYYVKETIVTFECETPSISEFQDRILKIASFYPYLVCRDRGEIVGYSYAHRHKERAAYQWNAELSVYVDRRFQRCGIGKALYTALIGLLRLQNIQNVYGGVALPNPNSENLHGHLGFTKLGIYRETGYKFDAWHDVAWFEKAIGDHRNKPKAVVPISEIGKEARNEIISGSSSLIRWK